jgi:hypothetical protein
MKKMLISTSAALLLLIVFATPAFADGPVLDGPYPSQGTEVMDCGSFQILDNYVGQSSFRWFYEQQGNPDRLMIRHWGTDTFTNSVTGQAYKGSYDWNYMVDFSTIPPQGSALGMVYVITIPGAGAVMLEAGRIVMDRYGNVYFEAGPHQLSNGDFGALCAAME